MAINTVGTGGSASLTTAELQQLGTREKRLSASERLTLGNRELTRLGSALSKLYSALERLAGFKTSYSRQLGDAPVVVRSLELGLTYTGSPNDLEKTLDAIPSLSGISAGTFTVNGASLAVDPAIDTLPAVLARIQASGAGVTASLDTGADRLELEAQTPRRPLTLGDGTSGLFSALSVSPRQYAPAATRTPSLGEPRKLRDLFAEVSDALTELFEGDYKALDAEMLDTARASIREVVEDVAKNFTGAKGDVLRTGLGIEFDFRDASSRPPGRALLTVSTREMSAALDADFPAFRDFLLGPEEDGLAPRLRDAVEKILGTTVGDLGTKLAAGAMLDMRA